MIEGVDYFVRLVRFPNTSTPGQVWLNDDGTFDIYLDERLTDEERERVFLHELRHIERDHFYSSLNIRDIEREADGKRINIFNVEGMLPEFKSLDALKHWAVTYEST